MLIKYALSILQILRLVAASDGEPRFSVVVDAGSTGCRAYAYQISDGRVSLAVRGPKSSPGLASLQTADTASLKKYVAPLIDFARSAVPEEQWSSTHFSILATAGMRLLPEEAANALYNRIHEACSSQGLKIQHNEIRTISGEDEAYYAALAVNYAFGESATLLGALDLGGASTQIAAPLYLKKKLSAPEPKNFAVRSFLGYGVEVLSLRYFAKTPVTSCTHTTHDIDRFEKCEASIVHFLGIQDCRREGSSLQHQNRLTKNTTSACQLPELYPQTETSRSTTETTHSSSNLCERFDISDPRTRQRLNKEAAFVATSLYYYAWRSLVQMLRFAGNISAADALAREWPRPSLTSVRAGAKALCAKSSSQISALASDNSKPWDAFIGDAERRQKEMPRRCFDLAYIDILLDRVFALSNRQVAVAVAVDELDLDWTLGFVLDQTVRLGKDHFAHHHEEQSAPSLSYTSSSAAFLRGQHYTIFFIFLFLIFAILGCCCQHGHRSVLSGKKEKCDRPVGAIARSGMRMVWAAPVLPSSSKRDPSENMSLVLNGEDAASPTRARSWGSRPCSRQSSLTKLSSLANATCSGSGPGNGPNSSSS